MIPVNPGVMLPPKNNNSHIKITKIIGISNNGKKIPQQPAIIDILKQASRAFLFVYPPKYWINIPPDKTPKVGAVIQTIENIIYTFDEGTFITSCI